ncbi:MAG: O-antigen ligase family protein [Gemmatimonadaceae bacterium]
MTTATAPHILEEHFVRARRRMGPLTVRQAVLAGYLLAHGALGLAMWQVPAIARVHAIATVAAAFLIALGRRADRVVYATAYITGSEVLWRIIGAQPFWEFGKYAAAGTMLLALWHMRGVRLKVLPLLYLLLLLPSVLLTFHGLALNQARQYISFNLSGPFLLAVAATFFAQVRLTPTRTRKAFAALIGPVIGIIAITLFTTYTAEEITFTSQSNVVTSGGFGPNQVSAVLGLGALLAFLNLTDRARALNYRALMLAVLIAAVAQSAMTFSRGGLFSAAGAAVIGSLYLLRDARSRTALVASAIIAFGVANFLLFPRLDAFTGGALSKRFERIDTTNRSTILREDIEVFVEHPLFGVGPGRARDYRDFIPSAAHTEFSRVMAEHGVLGIVSTIALLLLCAYRLRAASTAREKAIVSALLVWSLLFMTHSGMRIAAPAFLIGLACSRLQRTTLGAGPRPGEHAAAQATPVLDPVRVP